MKINITSALLASSMALLISYGLYSMQSFSITNQLIIGVSSFIQLTVQLIFLLALQTNSARTNINIRTISIVFLLINLGSNTFFALQHFNSTTYIITNGLLFSSYLLIVFKISTNESAS
jgi:heme/copper-type cytochrome/quinol oxidase subunit 4